MIRLKSDQNGIETPDNVLHLFLELVLKSDQNGIETTGWLGYPCVLIHQVKIRPKWD